MPPKASETRSHEAEERPAMEDGCWTELLLVICPLVNQHGYGESLFSIGKSSIHGPFSTANC